MASKTPVPSNPRPGSVTVSVIDAGGFGGPLGGAFVSLYRRPDAATVKFDAKTWKAEDPLWVATARTDDRGQVAFDDLAPDHYVVIYEHHPLTSPHPVEVGPGCNESVCLRPNLAIGRRIEIHGADCRPSVCPRPRTGDTVHVSVEFNGHRTDGLKDRVELVLPPGAVRDDDDKFAFTKRITAAGPQAMQASLRFDTLRTPPGALSGNSPGDLRAEYNLAGALATTADEPVPTPVTGSLNIALDRSQTEPTADLRLWMAIRASTESLSFTHYASYMESLFCGKADGHPRSDERAAFGSLLGRRFLPFTDTDAYRVMKAATEAFVMVNCGVFADDGSLRGDPAVLADLDSYLDRRDLPRPGSFPYLERVDNVPMLPYLAVLRRKLPDVPIVSPARGRQIEVDVCDGFIEAKLRNPCLLELIWSYWHEEGMQVQGMNAVTRRFQNLRGPVQPDPLANLEVHPLRPLSQLLWGYIQDEQHRLTVARRNAEYDHHYGLRLEGRAVQGFLPADSRSKFLEAFHHLLQLCTVFYKQDDDTTVKADAFGVLNALKEVHLILSQGAHSQFADMPATSRTELLMQQWLYSRPEFREFLPTRAMVAYPEPWMDRVDALKTLFRWTDTSVIHFHNLAVFGEQLLLAIRYGAWSTVFEPTQAFNFARFWRPQIQGYVHAYRAATGVVLSAERIDAGVDATLPSVLLQRRLAAQRRSV